MKFNIKLTFYETDDKINFIYHTTPHRGLEILYYVFDNLSKKYDNIHLDVYSSFDIYGWGDRDKNFSGLFEMIQNHSHMTYNKNIPREKLHKKMKKYEGTYFHLKRCGAIGLFSLFLSSGILFFLLSFIRPDNFLFLLFPRF